MICMKSGGGRSQTSTQVKEMIPEIKLSPIRPTFLKNMEGSILSFALARRKELGGVEVRCMIPQRIDRDLGEP